MIKRLIKLSKAEEDKELIVNDSFVTPLARVVLTNMASTCSDRFVEICVSGASLQSVSFCFKFRHICKNFVFF